MSGGVVLAVLGALVSTDERLREQVRALANSTSPSTVADAGVQLREMGTALLDAAQTQSIEHAPMMIFVAVATVLLLFMVRA